MSAERKKLLWISITGCVVVLLMVVVGFFLMAPKKDGAQAPAAIGNSAPPKAQDPQDFLSTPPPAPAIEQPRNPDGSMIIVYGDNPKPGAAGIASPATTAPASSNGTSSGPTGSQASPRAAASATPAAAAPSPAPIAKAAPVPSAAATSAKPAAAAKPAAKKPAPVPKADDYWIQAASFTSRGRADELKQSLAEKGIAALITVKDISGKSYYRIRIGPYASKTEAEGWLGRLKVLPGCGEAYVSATAAPAASQKN